MQKPNQPVLTNAGRQMLNDVAGSKGKITYTKAVMYGQDLSSMTIDQLRDLTTINDSKLETKIGVSDIKLETVTIIASFSNATVMQDTTYSAIGWYASTTVDSAEKLIAVIPYEKPQTLIAGSNGKATASTDIQLLIHIGDDVNVELRPIEEGLISEAELKNALTLLSSKGLLYLGDEITDATYQADRKCLDKISNTSIKHINLETNSYRIPYPDTDSWFLAFIKSGWLLTIADGDSKRFQLLLDTDDKNGKNAINSIFTRVWTTQDDGTFGYGKWTKILSQETLFGELPQNLYLGGPSVNPYAAIWGGGLEWNTDGNNGKGVSVNLDWLLTALSYGNIYYSEQYYAPLLTTYEKLFINHAKLMEILTPYGKVKSVNGTQPDTNGDVKLDVYSKKEVDSALSKKVNILHGNGLSLGRISTSFQGEIPNTVDSLSFQVDGNDESPILATEQGVMAFVNNKHYLTFGDLKQKGYITQDDLNNKNYVNKDTANKMISDSKPNSLAFGSVYSDGRVYRTDGYPSDSFPLIQSRKTEYLEPVSFIKSLTYSDGLSKNLLISHAQLVEALSNKMDKDGAGAPFVRTGSSTPVTLNPGVTPTGKTLIYKSPTGNPTDDVYLATENDLNQKADKSSTYSKSETYSKDEAIKTFGKTKTINNVAPDSNGNIQLIASNIPSTVFGTSRSGEQLEINPSVTIGSDRKGYLIRDGSETFDLASSDDFQRMQFIETTQDIMDYGLNQLSTGTTQSGIYYSNMVNIQDWINISELKGSIAWILKISTSYKSLQPTRKNAYGQLQELFCFTGDETMTVYRRLVNVLGGSSLTAGWYKFSGTKVD